MHVTDDPERLRPATPRARRTPGPHPPRQPVPWLTLGVIATGGIIGALTRLGIETAFPHRTGSFDWATLAINVTGCALIGALMVILTEVRQVHRLAGPFLGTGVLGGFTTFSAYIVDIQQSLTHHAPQIAFAYLAVTLAAGLAAGYAAVTLTRRIASPHHKDTARQHRQDPADPNHQDIERQHHQDLADPNHQDNTDPPHTHIPHPDHQDTARPHRQDLADPNHQETTDPPHTHIPHPNHKDTADPSHEDVAHPHHEDHV